MHVIFDMIEILRVVGENFISRISIGPVLAGTNMQFERDN